MTAQELADILTNMSVTPEQLITFFQSGMSSLEVDALKNRIAKIRRDQSAYNADVEAQVQEIQAQINAMTELIVGGA